MEPASPPSTSPPSGRRSASYRFVEGLHLRQWALRAAVPLAVLQTNGRGPFDVPWWPRHDAVDPWFGGAAGLVAPLGVVLVLLAAWMRVLAKGVLVRKTTLTTGGVYRVVRHPFYLANLIGAAGVFLLAGPLGGVVGACWLMAALPIYHATIRGEEDGLSTLYPDGWDRFAARVPALLPIPGRLGEAPGDPVRVTWANLIAEREPARGLRFLAGASLVAGCTGTSTLHTTALACAVVLYGLSHVVPGPPSRRAAD